MNVQLNHTIVWCRDPQASAEFLTGLLGLPAPARFGPFHVVTLANGVSLDFLTLEGVFAPQHYAFLVTEADFDAIFGRIREQKLEHWADPARLKRGEINHHDGGCGTYFMDLDGHLLEILTRPYGSGSQQ